MKILMDSADIGKCRDVHVSFDIEELPGGGNMITMVCSQRRKDGTFEIFHQDTFWTPE